MTPWKSNRGEGGWSSTIVRTPHPVCVKSSRASPVLRCVLELHLFWSMELMLRFFQLRPQLAAVQCVQWRHRLGHLIRGRCLCSSGVRWRKRVAGFVDPSPWNRLAECVKGASDRNAPQKLTRGTECCPRESCCFHRTEKLTRGTECCPCESSGVLPDPQCQDS